MSPILDLTDSGSPRDSLLIWEVTIGEYRYALFSDRRALVYKGDSTKASYEITYSGCNCPSAVYGKQPCKHEKPIVWKGDGAEEVDIPIGDTDDVDDIISSLLD